MKIKICGLTDRKNMEAVLSLYPDYIGLIFYKPSKRFVKYDKALASWLSLLPVAAKIGVFVNEPADVINQTIVAYRLDYVQLHGAETPAFCAEIGSQVPVIKAFPMHATFDFEQLNAYAPFCRYFLFDTPTPAYGGSGCAFDWELLQKEIPLPFLLSGGIGPGDADRLQQFRHPAFAGIDVNSGFEQSPGIKNIELLKEFIHEIRNR